MRKFTAFALCLLLLLTGCAGQVNLAAGNFSFELPEGYSASDITEQYCTILQNAGNTPVGGIKLTTLSQKDLNGKNTDNIINYLMEDFHQTKNVEWLASYFGSNQKIVVVHLDKFLDDGQEKPFSHIFFEKDSIVHHIWLDLNFIDSETEELFRTMTGVD